MGRMVCMLLLVKVLAILSMKAFVLTGGVVDRAVLDFYKSLGVYGWAAPYEGVMVGMAFLIPSSIFSVAMILFFYEWASEINSPHPFAGSVGGGYFWFFRNMVCCD
ncbi:hypothetical protein ACTSKR_11875 [Chitinibacteraceae bacterium HSL-7]